MQGALRVAQRQTTVPAGSGLSLSIKILGAGVELANQMVLELVATCLLGVAVELGKRVKTGTRRVLR
jgi:hypothetical protein